MLENLVILAVGVVVGWIVRDKEVLKKEKVLSVVSKIKSKLGL